MIPIFTIAMIIFVIVLRFSINKNKRAQTDASEKFWERERLANFTRKKDIDGLDYITIPLEKFPLNLHSKSEETLSELSKVRILNLTGISNTDLKYMYGVSNLPLLTEYDTNFTKLVSTLDDYAKELVECGQTTDARTVLEYAVSIHADSRSIYTSLANLYAASQEPERIADLIASAEELNSASKQRIIDALTKLQERP